MFYGPGYDKVKILIMVMSPVILLMGIENVIGTQYLIPTKQQNKYTASVTCGLIINFILNYFLIIKWQAIGASIATILSQLVVDGLQLYSVRKEMDLKEMFKPLFKYLMVGLLMFICCNAIGYVIDEYVFIKEYFMEISEYIRYGIKLLVQVITYFGILIMSKDALIMPVLDKFKKRFVKG